MAQALYTLTRTELVIAFERGGYYIENPEHELKDHKWVSYDAGKRQGMYRYKFFNEAVPPGYKVEWLTGECYVSYDEHGNIIAEF